MGILLTTARACGGDAGDPALVASGFTSKDLVVVRPATGSATVDGLETDARYALVFSGYASRSMFGEAGFDEVDARYLSHASSDESSRFSTFDDPEAIDFKDKRPCIIADNAWGDDFVTFLVRQDPGPGWTVLDGKP